MNINSNVMMFCWMGQNDLSNVPKIQKDKNLVTVVKKTHNVKNNLLCTPQKRIIWLSRTYDGHVHDKKIADQQALSLPTGITLWQDTGFIGHNPKNVNVKMPTKRPKEMF